MFCLLFGATIDNGIVLRLLLIQKPFFNSEHFWCIGLLLVLFRFSTIEKHTDMANKMLIGFVVLPHTHTQCLFVIVVAVVVLPFFLFSHIERLLPRC